MKDLFLTAMRLCLSASIVLAAVVLLRFVLKKLKAPKALSCALWALVALRLLIPVFPSARVSLVPQPVGSGQVVELVAEQAVEETRTVREQEPVYQEIVRRSPEIPVRQEPTGERYVVVSRETLAAPKTVKTGVVPVLARIWAGGIALMLGYMLLSYLRVRRKVRASLQQESNVYRCDALDSPFILGLFRPRIYLPSDMDPEDEAFVLAHEQAHLKRLDHLWKPLGFLLLAVYWFNPLFWLGYILLCRDIEGACDEKVVREESADYRKAYSRALVNCSAPRRMISACPLAFGETGVKGRIRAVLNYKKPAFWMLLAALVIAAVTAGCALTNGKGSSEAPTETEQPSTEVTTEAPAQDSSEAPTAAPTQPTEPTSHSGTSVDTSDYLYDRLDEQYFTGTGTYGVEMISYEEFNTPCAPNEVKMVYTSTAGKMSQCYKADFDEGPRSDIKQPVSFRVTLNGLGGSASVWESEWIDSTASCYLLYRLIDLRAYRPLEASDREKLPLTAPLAWCTQWDSRTDICDLFVLTEDGDLFHAPWSREKDLPDEWTEAEWDTVSKKPLDLLEQMGVAAVGILHLDCRELVPFPTPKEFYLEPEEYWKVTLEADGQERALTGHDIMLLEQLYGEYGLQVAWVEEAVYHAGDLPAACESAVKITVTDGRAEAEPAAVQASMYLTEDGRLIVERPALTISPLGVMDGFAVRARIWAEADRKLSPEVYQNFKAVTAGAPVEFEEKVISVVSVLSRYESTTWPNPSWQIPRTDRGDRVGPLYGEDTEISDFLYLLPGDFVTGQGELFLLDSGNKQLIQYHISDNESFFASIIPQDFLNEPRLLCPAWTNGEIFILDKDSVNRILPNDAATGDNRRPLPSGLTADDVEDMILVRTADGPELVLITRTGVNYGMTPWTEAEVQTGDRKTGFVPTESGWHLMETEQAVLVRVGEVTWKLPRFNQKLRILAVGASRLSVSLTDEAAQEAWLRDYVCMTDGVHLSVSRIDLSDWMTVPGRLWRDENVLALRAESLDVYTGQHPGTYNIASPSEDAVLAALAREAGDASEVSAEEFESLEAFFGDDMVRRFLIAEFETPQQADLSLVLGEGWGYDWPDLSQEERSAALNALSLDVRYANILFKYSIPELNDILDRVLGLTAEDFGENLPGVYLPEYDARYLPMEIAGGGPLLSIRAARLLPDGTVLAAWKDPYDTIYGLARLQQTPSGWHLLSNRILYQDLGGFYGY
ncbi:MAG: hypothetical protein J5493_00955 [Lachnospiraceae bacterium]|nr:hypothetical protein [Lachnospiraceae bacterium]